MSALVLVSLVMLPTECGNPLLRDWIGEWMEKARDQQSKAYFTYKKAHDSISKCPIVFQHPSEADQLHGIGAGMVAKLEKKMTEHCVAHRLPLPARTKGKKRTAVDSQEHSHHDNPCETSANKKPRQPRPPRIYVPTYRSGAYAILLSLLEYQENNQDQVTKEQIIRSAQNYCNTSFDLPPSGKNYTAWNSIKTLIEKSYVWKHGSPARYMLTEEGAAMALQLRNACLPSQTTHSKRRKTGPSHEEGEGGDSGNEEEEEETLVGDDVLSESQVDLSLYVLDPIAYRANLKSTPTTPISTLTSSSASVSTSTSTSTSTLASTFIKEQEFSLPKQTQNKNRFEAYNDGNNSDDDSAADTTLPIHKHSSPSEAIQPFIIIDSPSPTSLLYEFPSSQANDVILLSSPSPPPQPSSLSGFYDTFDYTTEAPPTAPTNTFFYRYLNNEGQTVEHRAQAAADQGDNGLEFHIEFHTTQQPQAILHHVLCIKETDDPTLMVGRLPEHHAALVCPFPSIVSLLSMSPEPIDDLWLSQTSHAYPSRDSYTLDSLSQDSRFDDTCSESQFSQTTQSTTTRDVQESRSYSATPTIEEREKGEGEGFDPFPPTTYDIVLVLDSREIKMRSNRDYIQERLVEKGVRVITRALDLGDVIWIAQKCGTESPGEGLFLDIVLERKRLDDLVSSIKDGRFKEQKRRLGQAGARKVMYVVEEHNKEEAARFGIQAIHAAMSGTQIMDGFYLKRTQSLDDTIDYLVCVTALVRKMYKGMTLYRIPEHLVSRNNYLALKTRLGQQQKEKANAYYVISYPLYNQLNSKHGTATLKDLYLRMLRVLRGVSGEKATAFAQIYPTPHSLLSAFDEKRNDRKAAQMMARDATEDSFMRRKWSTSLSKRLWETWGSNASESYHGSHHGSHEV